MNEHRSRLLDFMETIATGAERPFDRNAARRQLTAPTQIIQSQQIEVELQRIRAAG
jgi:hypothetical protein